MTTREQLDASLEDLSRAAMKVKRDRDALLAVAQTILFCAELEIKLGNKAWESPAKELREVIAQAEGKD